MKVVLRHAGRWLHFQHPERMLVARRIEEVLPLLAEAEASRLFAAGFVAYEAAPAFDAALQTHPSDGFPLLCLGLFHAPDVLDDIEEPPGAEYRIGELTPSVTQDEFTSAIHTIKERIAAGATYQVNYTYRLRADFSGDAWAFFHALVKGQRAEHAAFVETDEFAICSASPELFYEVSEGSITSRPMKGTAKRGLTPAEDLSRADALRASEKDRAENIMIVDMIRNDIGRVAAPGAVETVSKFDVEKYPTVWQMTSTVRGSLAPEISNTECRMSNHEGCSCGVNGIMQALFPCASITGAPKAKTMEIITELERGPRGVYTGAIGFAAPNGEASFNVAIRTAVLRGGALEFGVGGGIVWDSAAESEYEETLTKARVLTQPRPDFKLLETMLWEREGGIFLLDAHLRRLGDSAAYFDIPFDEGRIRASLEGLFHTLPCMKKRVRLLLDRDGSHEIQEVALGAAPSSIQHVAVAKAPVDSSDVFLYHKTTHRAVYEKAKADFPDHDDVILFNERGEVTESAIANVVARKDGRLVTPPVACGLLAGTFRGDLLAAGEIVEEVVSLADLRAAEEIFLINSVRGWRPARLSV